MDPIVNRDYVVNRRSFIDCSLETTVSRHLAQKESGHGIFDVSHFLASRCHFTTLPRRRHGFVSSSVTPGIN